MLVLAFWQVFYVNQQKKKKKASFSFHSILPLNQFNFHSSGPQWSWMQIEDVLQKELAESK